MSKKALTINPADTRKISAIPEGERTQEQKEHYHLYTVARDNIETSLNAVRVALGMGVDEFYCKYDEDQTFAGIIEAGFNDARIRRLSELQSALVTIALGRTIIDKSETTDITEKTDKDGEPIVVRETHTQYIQKTIPANADICRLLLEKLTGKDFSVPIKIQVETTKKEGEGTVDTKYITREGIMAMTTIGKEEQK